MSERISYARGLSRPRALRLHSIRTFAALAALFVAGPAAALSFRTVALSTDTAPGTGGALFLDFGPVVLNQSGHTAFTSTLQGTGVDPSNDLGMWSEGTGSLGLVERQGSPAVGVSGNWDTALAPPVLNDAGQVAFRAFTSGPTQIGVWHEGSGALAPVAVTGNPADGAPAGQSYASPFSSGPAFNDAGQVAFQAGLSGSGVTSSNDRAVWAGGPSGPLTLAARTGDSATGTGASWTGFERPLINASGDVAFSADLDDGGNGIWAGPASGVSLVARDGSTAPGTGGAEWSGFITPDWNDLGEVAFHAGLTLGVGGVTTANDRGIWGGAAGSLALLAREGDTAPDTGGRVFETFDTALTNDQGDVLFRGFLDTGTGLFVHDGSTLTKAVASDDVAPGTSIGLGDASFGAFHDWTLNDAGEVAFEATLIGLVQGVTGDNDGSLWLLDENGGLVLVVREGQLFEYAPGQSSLIESIDFFGEVDSLGRGLNDRGWLAFGLTFQNGVQGVFTAIPEPGTAALLTLGLLGLALRRRPALH